jgi:hypothetical protein
MEHQDQWLLLQRLQNELLWKEWTSNLQEVLGLVLVQVEMAEYKSSTTQG